MLTLKETKFTVVLIIPKIDTVDWTLLLDCCMIYFSEVGVTIYWPTIMKRAELRS